MATQKRAKASSTLELKAVMLHWLYTANYFPLSLSRCTETLIIKILKMLIKALSDFFFQQNFKINTHVHEHTHIHKHTHIHTNEYIYTQWV